MDRCWEELRLAGQELAEGLDTSLAVKTVAPYFDLPRSPEAEAVRVCLDALGNALADEGLLAFEAPPLPEAAQ